MSNSLTVPILLRKYANNLYSLFVISSWTLQTEIHAGTNICSVVLLIHSFTITILLMSFM